MKGGRVLPVSFASALVALLILGVTPAFAATQVTLTAGTDQTVLQIFDAGSDADDINISLSDNTITTVDNGMGGAATPDPDCTAVNATTVTCPFDPPDPPPPAAPLRPVNAILAQLNNGDDSFVNQNIDVPLQVFDPAATGNKTVVMGPGGGFVITGGGNDNITGSAKTDSVSTQAGADTLSLGDATDIAQAGAGDDVVDAGPGNDQIVEDGGPNGADVLDGGPGRDTAGYQGIAPVTIILNGQPDDGRSGEGDNVMAENIFGAGGNDTLIGDDGPNQLFGGDGDDQISAAGGTDSVSPGDGNDTVDAGDGTDSVSGASFADGADSLNGGGGGDDLVNYCCGPEPITIAQDGQANDGRAGEGDNLAGFESFAGGDAADTIMGDAGRNLLNGNDGNDLLVGLGGGDQFFGGAGDDTVVATEPVVPATARAAAPASVIADDLDCDLGFDTVAASAADLVAVNCERQGARFASDSATVSKKGKASLLVECPFEEGAPCAGKLALLSNGKQIAKGSYNVANGKAKKATAKLSKKGRKALAKAGGSLLVTAEARTNEPPGVSTRAETVQLLGG